MNSATSEESAAASQELSSQANVMKSILEKFKYQKSLHGVKVKARAKANTQTSTQTKPQKQESKTEEAAKKEVKREVKKETKPEMKREFRREVKKETKIEEPKVEAIEPIVEQETQGSRAPKMRQSSYFNSDKY